VSREGAPQRVFTLEHAGWLHILPVCHYRAEFAHEVRQAIRILEPRVVAVELPSSLKEVVLRAVARLPRLSVVVFPSAKGGMIYLPVEPIDAGVEALRSALEFGAEVALVDLDVEGYADYRDPVPDPYAVRRVGLEAFYRAYRGAPRVEDPLDARREAAMAYHLQGLHEEHGGPILLVCGMEHAEGVRAGLERPQGIPFARPRRPEAMLFQLHPECLGEVLAEAPGVEAVYEVLRSGALEPEPEPDVAQAVGRQIGPFRILDGFAPEEGEQRLAWVREAARRSGWPLDRLRAQLALFELAVRRWERITGERLRAWQRDVFARYSRNLALSSGRLVCDAYDFLLAVRGVGDENLLYEAFELLMNYPWQETASDLPSVRISAEELELEKRTIRIRPRFHRPKQRLLPLKPRRRREAYPGEWLEGFDENGFCSYPREDVVIEGYAQFLRKKGTALVSEENVRVEPFRASILDGIDMRETLRHWATDRRIYVRELGRVPGEAACVVLIFDEDNEDERYPYRMTWLGEHEHESDMAFYSTPPAQGIVGPGIVRCEYGGVLMSYPPRRLLDVWSDPDYRAARSKAEILLLAALDYSPQRIIVHVAARPPRSFFKTLASRLDRKIVHIPLGQLSPQSLQRIRVFHILGGRSKREIAGEYIR
jgi:hypothetical protein